MIRSHALFREIRFELISFTKVGKWWWIQKKVKIFYHNCHAFTTHVNCMNKCNKEKKRNKYFVMKSATCFVFHADHIDVVQFDQ